MKPEHKSMLTLHYAFISKQDTHNDV